MALQATLVLSDGVGAAACLGGVTTRAGRGRKAVALVAARALGVLAGAVRGTRRLGSVALAATLRRAAGALVGAVTVPAGVLAALLRRLLLVTALAFGGRPPAMRVVAPETIRTMRGLLGPARRNQHLFGVAPAAGLPGC
jgi:hypothetical protein